MGLAAQTLMAPVSSQQRRGPLSGIKIIELAGVGPGPMGATALADLGATVLRIDRKQPSGLGLKRPLRYDLLLRNRKSIQLDLKDPTAVAGRAGAGRARRRTDRGIPARGGRTAGPGPGHLPAAQSASRLRTDDRLGSDRAPGAYRRPRPRLHRSHRRAAGHRPAAVHRPSIPLQPHRRLCRRRTVPGARTAGRHPRGTQLPARARWSMRP